MTAKRTAVGFLRRRNAAVEKCNCKAYPYRHSRAMCEEYRAGQTEDDQRREDRAERARDLRKDER